MTSVTAANGATWARVRGDVNCHLRRGAWYRVLALTDNDVVLDVHHEPRPVQRALVRLASSRPARWSGVTRPADAVQLPTAWGVKYGVCPVCQTRSGLESLATSKRCDECNGLFPIDWEEP
jgi:hypothetical protein